MDLQTTNSRQINANMMDGNNQIAAMFANFRPGKAFSVNLEIYDDAYAAARVQEIADAFDTFVANAMTQANACGVPVNAHGLTLEIAGGGAAEQADEGDLAPAT